jgi:RNA polymerase sigma-70 factor (ECF subfamily)
MMPAASEWISWVAPARAGSEDAFARLYRATRPRLHNAVAHLVGVEQAHEIVQRAYVKAWERLADLEEDAAFAGWIRRIAVNLVRDQWRSGRFLVDLPEDDGEGAIPDSAPDPSVQLDGLQDAQRLRQAVSSLPTAFREAVVLHYLDELPVEEVSRILDVPKGTVLSRLARGRERLKRILAPQREVNP